jgi:hydrogenase maturation protease
MSLLIIGIGTYHGNDQFGLYIVKELQSDMEYYQGNIQFRTCSDTGATLLNAMEGFEAVYLVDSVKAGAQVGEIFYFENEDIKGISDSISSHTIGLADTLCLGQVLNILPRRVIFYGMEMGTEAISWQLAAEENKFIRNFLNYLKEAINKEWLSGSIRSR